jgi:DNA polymerase-3 subunit gamma/tau
MGALRATEGGHELTCYRKRRRARFEDLIGQDAMVRTLSNAFDLERIHPIF